MSKYFYVARENDEYEYIIDIGDTLLKLSKSLGLKYGSVKSMLSRKQKIYLNKKEVKFEKYLTEE